MTTLRKEILKRTSELKDEYGVWPARRMAARAVMTERLGKVKDPAARELIELLINNVHIDEF